MCSVRQLGTVTALALASLPERWVASLVAIVGMAGVVAVLSGMLGMSSSLLDAMGGPIDSDRAIVVQRDAQSENLSSLDRDTVDAIENLPGIRRAAGGAALASPELLTTVRLSRASGEGRSEVSVRGIAPIAFQVHRELSLIKGRIIRSGRAEVMVGRSLQTQFKGLEMGSVVRIGNSLWTVVGVFGGRSNLEESELLADSESLLSALRRQTFQSVTVLVDPDSGLQTLRKAIAKRPTLQVSAMSEQDFRKHQSGGIDKAWSFAAYVVAGIMALGATCAATNTMYSAVGTRYVEIATLRAVGFESISVVISVLVESILLALVGALVGTAIVLVTLEGVHVRSFGQLGGSTTYTEWKFTPHLLQVSVLWACLTGLVGGISPAVRATRTSIAAALGER